MKHIASLTFFLLFALGAFAQDLNIDFDSEICAGNQTITANFVDPEVNPADVDFEWFLDGTKVSFGKGEQTFSLTAVAGKSYLLRCDVDLLGNRTGSLEKTIVVSQEPTLKLTANAENICTGETVELTSSIEPGITGTHTHTYSEQRWTGPNTPGGVSLTANFTPVRNEGAQTYTFSVLDDFGCSYEDELKLAGANADFSIDVAEGEAILDVNITQNTPNATALTWEILNSDNAIIRTISGIEALAPSILYRFDTPGSYDIKLTASLDKCTNTKQYSLENGALIKVEKSSIDPEIPNIFTPNGDNINDFFTIKSAPKSMKEYTMIILNRWGKKIYSFEVKDMNNPQTSWNDSAGWDGTINGTTKATDGTYFYILNAIGYDNVSYQFKGTLQLHRNNR